MVFLLLLNRIKIFFYKKRFKKIQPGFYKNFFQEKSNKFIIDLSNLKLEHFGDQLFFILPISCSSDKDIYTFKIDKKWEQLYKSFNLKFTYNELCCFDKNEFTLITTFRSFVELEKKNHFKKIILFDSMDKQMVDPLCTEISKFLNMNIKDTRYENSTLDLSHLNKNESLEKNLQENFYVFNDVIYSRSFIRPFLISSLRRFVFKNLFRFKKLIQVGGERDSDSNTSINESNILNLVDKRGKLSFLELFYILNHENCMGYIGFDNAIMHLSLFFNKTAFVKFRGRFLKKNRNYHMRCVNCAVGHYAKGLITYIK